MQFHRVRMLVGVQGELGKAKQEIVRLQGHVTKHVRSLDYVIPLTCRASGACCELHRLHLQRLGPLTT